MAPRIASPQKRKGVAGGIFHGKPKERNHYGMNHVLISLSQRKTPSKIFKLASKQHNNNSSKKPLAQKRFDFTHGALEYQTNCQNKAAIYTDGSESRCSSHQSKPHRGFKFASIFLRTHLQRHSHKGSMCTSHWGGGLGFGSFSTESSEVTNGGIRENKSTSVF